jgi:hypothetical protein
MLVEWQWQLCVNGLEIQGSDKVQIKHLSKNQCHVTISNLSNS